MSQFFKKFFTKSNDAEMITSSQSDVIKSNPDAAAAQKMIASAIQLKKNRQYQEAKNVLEEVLAMDHSNARAHNELGINSWLLNDCEEAIDSFNMAIFHDANFVEAYAELGEAYIASVQFKEAEDHYRNCIRLFSKELVFYLGLGRVLLAKNELDEAAELFRSILVAAPENVAVRCNYGLLLRTQGKLEEAEKILSEALQLDKIQPNTKCNYAMVLCDYGRVTEAIQHYDEILAIHPDMTEVLVSRPMALLLMGEYAKGWDDYENRWQDNNVVSRDFRFPLWNGKGKIKEKILVYGEQGLGDEIMFSSCIDDVLAMGHEVVLETSKKLSKLYTRSFPGVYVQGRETWDDSTWLSDVAGITAQYAIGSLPRLFRRTMNDFPRHSGYLAADEQRVEYWHDQLSGLGDGLKIGLSWRGGTEKTRGALRSIPLCDLAPILKLSGIHFINLQYGDYEEERVAFEHEAGVSVHSFSEALDDYDETAALVTALDCVVSVQTAIIHLTGALGKPAHVMIPFSPEWRYGLHGERMPWYPSVKLYRQTVSGDWSAVIGNVMLALDQNRCIISEHPE